ncbi:cysteine desulfurase [Nitrospina gracilis]|uniref:cysteine desulfurase n=1 Tax=Nitrospina gracilis TaxID=35801 RepID=UPI001F16C64A|nr:cysteine desulfurase [Nitrospina gracilis]MCF8720042.1 cysteine desulfurase/selenocysteine lyase [Nitrospina gracilis Nb-211]
MSDTGTVTSSKPVLDVDKIRKDFPVLAQKVHGKPLVYLDNAATTQKPWAVIERVHKFDSEEYGTVRRGAYKMSEGSTRMYEEARQKVADLLGTPDRNEIIFTSGTTQSVNLVAQSYGRKYLNEGDEVIISQIEHHANIVPWQMITEEKGAKLKIIPCNDKGELLMEEYEKLLSPKTKVVAVNHVSNALGTINPIKEIIDLGHKAGAVVLIDGAQSTPHMTINVRELDCDFYTFSGHKMYGPTGIGGVYGKMDVLKSMPPYVTGGDMIRQVTFEKTTFNEPPSRFEAGTPPISQAIGLAAAIEYMQAVGIDKIAEYEHQLLEHGTRLLENIDGLRIIGTAENKASILSFYHDLIHPHDMVTLLDQDGIAVRGGHHCAQPTMQRFKVPATTRASVSFYNKFEELDLLAESIRKAIKIFS